MKVRWAAGITGYSPHLLAVEDPGQRSGPERWEVIALPEAAAAARISAAVDGANLSEVAAQLRAHGDAVLAAGHPRLIAKAVRSLPLGVRTAHDHALLGLALVVLGDGNGAELALLHDGDSLPTSHAWPLAMSRHLAGEPLAALEILARVAPSDPDFDNAQALNWSAAASWMLGDENACARYAEAARRVATLNGADAAWAAAHSALALHAALEGDRRANAWHWHRALDAAQRAGDVLQEVRIRTNLGSHLLEEGRYEMAAPGLDQAATLAHEVGFTAFQALSSCNLGQCLLNLGRLDDAIACFDAARSAWQSTGSRMVAYALTGLGDTYRERGDLVLAKAAYDEAVAASGPRHPQALVPALDGLARVLAPDDPDAAWRVAAQGERAARGIERPRACLTLGWLRLASGDRADAGAVGRAVAEEAMRRRDRAALGEALELQAMCAADGDTRSRLLIEARAVWQETGDVNGSRRVAHALYRLSNQPGTEQLPTPASLLPAAIADTPSDGGCRPHPAGLLAALDAAARPRVEVRVLGRFEVRRERRAVDEREWQSRKARELVRVLVARRGRPITREALAELLWPDEEPGQLANRLSVALATVRRVFDPARAHAQGHYLRAEDGVIALNPERVQVDVEDFLREGTAALALRTVDPDQAHRRLCRIVDHYPGEPLAEDLYADWAIALRDEARAMLAAAARALAEDLAGASPADALPYLARVLDTDPYDEPAHVQLVSTLNALGRFGEAQRAHRRYEARMSELGLSVAPLAAGRTPSAAMHPMDETSATPA
jgi:DNA-binding SARP family transcriptional activator/tetratricopeptide (TPR) repeat protein